MVTLHFGSFDHPEYIGMHYENVIYLPEKNELTLLRNDDGRGRKLPVIRLGWHPGVESVSGTFMSQSEHYIGKLELTRGLNLDRAGIDLTNNETYLQPMSGVYKGYCSASDMSGFKLTSISLYPSRILMDKTAPESPMNTINYVGGGLCDYRSTRPPFTDWACEARTGASYNFYTGHVFMWQGAVQWDCQRTGTDTLACNGPRYSNCHLKLVSSNALPARMSSITATVNDGIPWDDREIPAVPDIDLADSETAAPQAIHNEQSSKFSASNRNQPSACEDWRSNLSPGERIQKKSKAIGFPGCWDMSGHFQPVHHPDPGSRLNSAFQDCKEYIFFTNTHPVYSTLQQLTLGLTKVLTIRFLKC